MFVELYVILSDFQSLSGRIIYLFIGMFVLTVCAMHMEFIFTYDRAYYKCLHNINMHLKGFFDNCNIFAMYALK